MKGINSLAIVLLLLLPILASGSDIVISELYKKYGIEGALVIASLDGTVEYVHNTVRAKRRYLPASTFKIPNTLIALEEGAIKDDKEIIKWDGIDKGWPSWNKDQNLKTAFSISCVWCYQKFAKHIGDERYIQYLNDLNYGNKKTGKEVTNFWLEGELAISSMEQIVFLRKICLENLPFKRKNIHLLKKIMIVEENPKYSLRAKTGWANRIKYQHGWYVGYIEVNGKTWLFANNIQIKSKSDLAFRKQLVIESLKLKKII
ncbi:Class D beta-lactamase [hydrothermal vent metagenome]|uniref:beta-lactamase n=1 Tax=hydrothermal vent metagenome TaxID=652676 RepID=A0A3B0WJ36_9ZZZZ